MLVLCSLRFHYLEYDKDLKDLGDTPEQDPQEQTSNRRLITYSDFDAIFDSLPLVSPCNQHFNNNV